MPPVIVLDDDRSDSDSSGTIENDPDQGCFLHEDTPEEITATFNEGDYLTDDCFQRLIRDWKPQEAASQTASAQTFQPEPPTPAPKRALPEACVDDILYRPGQSVELHDDSFLRIETVLEDAAGGFFLRGRRLVRASLHPGTYIPPWHNEVIWTVDDDNDHIDLPLAIVKRFVSLVFTNWYQPQRRAAAVTSTSKLYCRVKETKAAGAVQYLSPEDADEGHRFDPAAMRQDWRGPTRPFGEADEARRRRCRPVIDLDLVDNTTVVDLTDEPQAPSQRRYTFGDGFCGAGGVSAGASQAGLSVKWAFDHSLPATTTYRTNHPTAVCEQSDVFSFLTNDPAFLRVDVSHGSPPCQTFSPAHTVECASDDANSACIFSCADLIRTAKPRVHTMEETSGLFERHQEVFFRVIQDFLELGYSVRWGILNCMDYGVPQSRRRLIIIASGYILPVHLRSIDKQERTPVSD